MFKEPILLEVKEFENFMKIIMESWIKYKNYKDSNTWIKQEIQKVEESYKKKKNEK